MPREHRLALFDKGLRRFLVVGGLAGAGVVDRLAVEAGFQRHGLGIVDVALDVAERDRGPVASDIASSCAAASNSASGTTFVTMFSPSASLAVSTGDIR